MILGELAHIAAQRNFGQLAEHGARAGATDIPHALLDAIVPYTTLARSEIRAGTLILRGAS